MRVDAIDPTAFVASPAVAEPLVPSRHAGGRHASDPLPFALPARDELRLKLRTIRRRLSFMTGTAGEKDEDLPTIPGVCSLSIAARYIDGGRVRFVELIQQAMLNRIPCAEKWWLVFAELTANERAVVSFDDVCAASGVRPSELMANVVAVAMEFGQDVGNLVAATTHPGIVHQSAKSAQRIGGTYAGIGLKDREMLFQHQGFIPVPKTAVVTVNAHASATAQAAAAAASEPSLTAFSDTIRGLSAVRERVQHVLQARDTALDPIDVTAVPEPVRVPGES